MADTRPGLAAWLGGSAVVVLYGWFMGSLLQPLWPAGEDAAAGRAVDFELVDQHGERFRDEDLRGHVALVFFGYTFCPDICPTTLFEMREMLHGLGDEAADVRAVFVSVDPERDTPQRLQAYVSHFHPDLIALTGSPAQLAAAAASFGAVFRRGETLSDGGYLMDHTAFGHVLDGAGRLHTVLPGDATAADMMAAVRAVPR